MNFEEYLRLKETSISVFVDELERCLALDFPHTTLIAGSLIEGLGTTKSDVDVIVIASEIPNIDRRITVSVGKALVDVDIIDEEYYLALINRLSAWGSSPWDLSYEANFSYTERKLLNRFHSSLSMTVHCDGLSDNLPRPDLLTLAKLKLHNAKHNARTIQVDMVGFKCAQDSLSLILCSLELLGHAVDAVASAYMQSNPVPKWRARLLNIIDEEGTAVESLLSCIPNIRELFWTLNRIPADQDERSCTKFAERILAFSRLAFAVAEDVLVHRQNLFSMLQGEKNEFELGIPLSVDLELDVDFLISENSVQLGRLNEYGCEIGSFSSSEFKLILLHDWNVRLPSEYRLLYRIKDQIDFADLQRRLEVLEGV